MSDLMGAWMRRLRERKEWKLFAVLPKADRALAGAWWAALLLRGLLPAVFAIAMPGENDSGVRPLL